MIRDTNELEIAEKKLKQNCRVLVGTFPGAITQCMVDAFDSSEIKSL